MIVWCAMLMTTCNTVVGTSVFRLYIMPFGIPLCVENELLVIECVVCYMLRYCG